MLKNEALLKTQLAITRGMNNALNGKVYPLDSLHARGFLSPACPFCCTIAKILFELGERTNPTITPDELAQAQRRAEAVERTEYEREQHPEAKINNW